MSNTLKTLKMLSVLGQYRSLWCHSWCYY